MAIMKLKLKAEGTDSIPQVSDMRNSRIIMAASSPNKLLLTTVVVGKFSREKTFVDFDVC